MNPFTPSRLPLQLSILATTALFGNPIPLVEIIRETDNATPATFELVWPSQAGKQYEVLQSTDLEVWESAATLASVDFDDSVHFGLDAQDAPLFFRILSRGEQLLNLDLPEDGLRMDSYSEFDGPRWPSEFGEGHVTLWHEDKFAAYSITIDDNNSPDFPFWLDVSDTYGWKFTWFVIVHPYVWDIYENVPGSNTGYFGTLEEFKDLHELGHDIQLHGACGEMNDLSAADYEDHITRSINVLSQATGAPVISFAYPCGKQTSRDGLHDYHEIISRHMVGARGTSGGTTPVHLLDYLNTKSLGVNALADGEPSNLFSRVFDGSRGIKYTQYRGWCVTLYHGLSDEAAKNKALETFDYVKDHEDQFWVAPFTDVAKYAQERESHSIEVLSVMEDQIEFIVTDRMNDALFDHPLSIKFRLDDTWTSASAEQDGSAIPVRILYHDDVPYALVHAVPDRGKVVLRKKAP